MSSTGEETTLVLLLGRLERLNDALVNQVCNQQGVSPGELRVLAMLRHGADPEGIRPVDIGRWVVQTTGGLTATISRLEAGGRIERRTDPDDARAKRVVLTEDGRSFYDSLLAELEHRYGIIFDQIDVESSLASVRDLINAFERAGGHSLSGSWSPVEHFTKENK